MNAKNKIDERSPKEILRDEIYLKPSMIRRITNCTYNEALSIIKKGLAIEKSKNLYIVKKKEKQIRTTTFKEMTNL